jgi:hypothetical protein
MENSEYLKTLILVAFITLIPILTVSDLFFTDDVEIDETKSSSGECILGDCENGYGIYAFDDNNKYIGIFKDNQAVPEQGDLWLHISDEFKEGAESFYLRANSVEIGEKYLYAEDMSDLREEFNPFNAKSFKNYVEINCVNKSARPLHTKMYSEPLAQGEVTATSEDLTVAFDFVSFSESERGAVYAVICEQVEDFKINPNLDSIVFKLPLSGTNYSFNTSIGSF